MQIDLKLFLKKPLFIVLEGLDCAGKSTQVKLLCDRLNEEGIVTSTTAEAKGTPIADVIRAEYMTGKRNVDNMVNALSFSADRYDRFTNEDNGVIKRLKQGESVIADRWILSSLVYSCIGVKKEKTKERMQLMMNINYDIIREVSKHANIISFYIYYLEEEMEKIISRASNRGSTEIYETIGKQKALSSLYDQAILAFPELIRYRECITAEDSIQKIHEELLNAIIREVMTI